MQCTGREVSGVRSQIVVFHAALIFQTRVKVLKVVNDSQIQYYG